MATTAQDAPDRIGLLAAASLVVASMIGTGIFTSLGFQIEYIDSVFALLMLWVIGGGLALCGALAYGELGAALPHPGGEYHLLSRIYHPALGFLAGWISATLGFVGPIALAAIAFGEYTTAVFPSLSALHLASGIVIVSSVIHGTSVKLRSQFQNLFTGLKVLLVVLFIGAAAGVEAPQSISVLPTWEGLGAHADGGRSGSADAGGRS